jgi:predicted dehydrogenase
MHPEATVRGSISMQTPIKIVVSGIGNRALPKNPENSNWLGWVELIKRSPDFHLVAAHDMSPEARRRIWERGYLTPEQTFADLGQMLRQVQCDAILVCNPAEHHALTIKQALDHDLHMLIEKPLGNNLSEAKEVVELIERKNLVVSVIQNWRCKDVGRLLREHIQNGRLGRIGHIFFRYIRDRENPNYPPYIFKEEFPLLYAMGIHHLDLCRYILGDEYVSVSGHSFKPPWSLYQSDTGLHLFLKTKGAVTVMYSGTISSQNRMIPQESLVVEGEWGTLANESQWLEPPLWFFPKGQKEKIDLSQAVEDGGIAAQYNQADIFLLNNFSQAISGRQTPVCTARDALQSIVALEACRLSCESGKVVFMNEL